MQFNDSKHRGERGKGKKEKEKRNKSVVVLSPSRAIKRPGKKRKKGKNKRM